MAVRRHNFEEIFRAQDPFISPGFRGLVREMAGTLDASALREFLIRFNGELYRAAWIDKTAKAPWAGDMLVALVNGNPELTKRALRELLDEMKLHYQDPLTEVVFESARRAPALLALTSEMVQTEA